MFEYWRSLTGLRRRAALTTGALAAAAAVLIPVGSASGPSSTVKDYDACLQYTPTCSTSSLPAGATVSISLTLTNRPTSNVAIGSANLDAPAGFAIDSSQTANAGPGSTSHELQLRGLNIVPNSSQQFTFKVTVPCSGSGPWSLQVKQSNTFNGPPGNDFNAVNANGLQSTVAAGGGPLDHFAVTLPSTPSPFYAVAGTSFTPTVTALDSCNNVATGFDTTSNPLNTATLKGTFGTAPNPLASASPQAPLPTGVDTSSGATIGGFTAGVAHPSVTAVKAETARTLTVTATGQAGTSQASTAFDVRAAAPAQLAFSGQPPSMVQKNGQFGAAVSVEDAWGNPTASAGNVTLSLNAPADPGAGGVGASLSPATPSAAIGAGGTATFSGLSVDTSGIGYTLTAHYGTVAAQSGLFNVLNLAQCGGGGCSGGDTSTLGSLTVDGPDTSGQLGAGLSPPGSGPFSCLLSNGTQTTLSPLGSSFQIVPPARANPSTDYFNIKVVLTVYKRALQGRGVSNLVTCKSYTTTNPSTHVTTTTMQQVPVCPSPAKKWLTSPTGAPFACIVSQTSSNAGDAIITMLINSQDPWGHTG